MPVTRSRFNSSSTSFSRNLTPRSPQASAMPARNCSITSTRKSSKRSAFKAAACFDRFNERLWLLTRYMLGHYARFDEHEYSFHLPAIRSPARRSIRARTGSASTLKTPTPTASAIRWPSESSPRQGAESAAGGGGIRLFRRWQEHRRPGTIGREERMADLFAARRAMRLKPRTR